MLPLDTLPPPPAALPPGLLSGVRVLDLSTSVAAPYAGMLLGDLGAEVIKIERPGTGDDSRSWGPPFLGGESLWYLSVNRNKKSVALQYSAEAGRAALHKLVAASDVVIVNLVPRVQAKWGVDYASLKLIRPDLVFVSVTGFGLDGARAHKGAYDLIAEGYSGVMDITGEPDSGPQKIGTPAADLLAGMDAAMATLAALFDRQRTGRGHLIDIALVDSMTRFLAPRIVPYLGSGEVPARTGARDSVIAIYQAFETADLPITVALGNDRIWERFWTAVGDPSYAADPRFVTNADRRALRAEIVERIGQVLKARPRADWLDLFDQADVPAGPINRVDEICADPEMLARGMFYQMDRGDVSVPQVGLGIRFDQQPHAPRIPPPRLGQHTDEVLKAVGGLTDADLGTLRELKAI